ncbi:hypothetical protein LOB59_06790 [Lactobacillus delbrueckii subsp. lactis]|nr:hypothetical protein [Lactobacillus delbrueckii subsp. lactis]
MIMEVGSAFLKNKNNSPKWNIGHKEYKKNYVKNEKDLITVPGKKK